MFVALVVIAAGIGAFFWWRKRSGEAMQASRGHKRASTQRAPAISGATQRFASVALRCSSTACSAARGLEGRAILATEAPVLPLAGCDAESCHCGYHKTADRREDLRRTSDHGITPIMFAGSENRAESDRRG
jgi:hypothetical protein